jgi:hypothetical protein
MWNEFSIHPVHCALLSDTIQMVSLRFLIGRSEVIGDMLARYGLGFNFGSALSLS